MKIQIAAVGMDMTPATKTYATEKAGKLERLVVKGHRDSAVLDVKLIAEESNTKDARHQCRLTLAGIGGGDTLHVEAKEPDMHVAVDRAVDRLQEALRRHEERYRDHIRRDATEAKQQAAQASLDPGEDERA